MFDDYRALKAHNWSSIKNIHTSPLLYKYRLDHPEPPKQAYTIGDGIHTRTLQPEHFDRRFVEYAGKRDKRVKAYQGLLEAMGPDCHAVKPAEMMQMVGASDAVLDHPIAAPLIEGARKEETITWNDAETGLPCKCRVDIIDHERIADLKKTRDVPTPRQAARTAAQFLYHGQLAMYHDGAVAAKLIDGDDMPGIVFVEDQEPFDVAVYLMKPDDLEAGRNLYRSFLRRILECQAADYWPGVAPDLQYLELPGWAPGVQREEGEDW